MVDIYTRHLGLYWVATDKLEYKNMEKETYLAVGVGGSEAILVRNTGSISSMY